MMALTELEYPTSTAFAFLENILSLFFNTFSNEQILNATSYSLNEEFEGKLRDQMRYYNDNKSSLDTSNSMNRLKQGVTELKNDVYEAGGYLLK